MKGMDGWDKILRSFGLRPWIFLRDEPEQTKTKVNPRRFGYVQIIHYRCIGVYFYLPIYTGYLFRSYLFQGFYLSPGNHSGNRLVALSPVLFLGRARAYPIYLRLSQAAPCLTIPVVNNLNVTEASRVHFRFRLFRLVS